MVSMALSEILEKTSQQPIETQGEYIRLKYNPSLGQIIRYAYDATYEWDLPEGNPPYRKNIYLDQESNLYSQMRRMYIFMKGTGDHISQIKKELNFISILENVSPADADLLIAAKDGSLPYGITMAFIEAELPGLITKPRTVAETAPVAEATKEPEPTFPEPAAEPETAAPEQAVERAPVAKAPARKPVKKPVSKAKKPVAKKAKVAEK
jgi:hypothetical protein